MCPGYSFKSSLNSYHQLNKSLPGDARHLSSISKFKKETLLLRPFKVQGFVRGTSTRVRTVRAEDYSRT
jgi:hypothetical protein